MSSKAVWSDMEIILHFLEARKTAPVSNRNRIDSDRNEIELKSIWIELKSKSIRFHPASAHTSTGIGRLAR